MAKTFVMASGKGGTGKSTCCAFLGEALANDGHSVLIIELDAGMRTLDLLLGVGESVVYDLGDVLLGGCDPMQAVMPSAHTPNLFLICAPFDSEARYNKEDLAMLCRWLGKRFDIIILDAGAGMGHNVQCGLTAADTVLVVVNPDIVSVRHARTFAEMARRYGAAAQRLIINRLSPLFFDKPPSQLPDLDAVIDMTGVQLIGVVPVSEEVRCASAAGTPLRAGTPAAEIYSRIAGRMIGRYAPLYVY